MRADKAIESLEELKLDAESAPVMSGGEHLTAWKGKVRGVLVAALGKDDHLVDRFDKVNYSLMVATSNTPAYKWDDARHGGIRNACGVIDAALYQLRLQVADDEPVDVRSYDPELWEHVKQLVEDEDWGKVASQTASSSKAPSGRGPVTHRATTAMPWLARVSWQGSSPTTAIGGSADALASGRDGGPWRSGSLRRSAMSTGTASRCATTHGGTRSGFSVSAVFCSLS